TPKKAGPTAWRKRHALGGTHFCAQSRDRNSFPLIFPWGQNLPLNHALGLAASHTLSGKFPCMCPVHPHMSAGRDFFYNLARFYFKYRSTARATMPPSRPLTKNSATPCTPTSSATNTRGLAAPLAATRPWTRSEEHTSELQSRFELVCRLLLEKNKTGSTGTTTARPTAAPHNPLRHSRQHASVY